jgi:regulator of replication initiation timing
MKKIFNQAWKYFAGGATILGYQAFFERLQSPAKTLVFKNNLNSQFEALKTKIADLKEEISSTISSDTKTQLTDKLNELTISLKNMESIHKKYLKKFEDGNISADSENSINLYSKYKEEFHQAFSNVNDKASEVLDLLNQTKNKFMVDNPIIIAINDFKKYLASLSLMEICLIINISSCVFILTCIISILFAISGNYLIDKFSLEQKLPKLSKVIHLRVKFQRYYVFINSVFIILAILSLIFVNTITLINS